MLSKKNSFLASTFESFINFPEQALFETSTLSKTGMPKQMISAIHSKLEHFSEKYPRMGHTYRGGAAIPMPYQHFTPSHDIEIEEPLIVTGRKTNVDPYSGREIRSQYTDFHWFIESLPFGPNRVLIANPDLEFFMYIYDKSKSKGAPGMQYAIMYWDKDTKKAVDFGYSELTTRAVDRSEIRSVHDTKGGNRSDKIQEFVRTVTRTGDKAYAPSPTKPLYIYKLGLDITGAEEPRTTRETRKVSGETALSKDVIAVFADKYANILPKLKPAKLNALVSEINNFKKTSYAPAPQSVVKLADSLGVDKDRLHQFLFGKFRDFRKEIFEEGRSRTKEGISSYPKTSGFELEEENAYSKKNFGGWNYSTEYSIKTKSFSPDEERRRTETGQREAQPEQYRRSLPVPSEYASIQGLIKMHTLDGILSKFAWFLTTGQIKFPEVSIAGLLGITGEELRGAGIEDWLF